MRLERFRVTNFRSVEDSGEVTASDLVCLVGKNEAGKTAILHALAGLNPHPSTPIEYDKERDYPRRHLTEYSKRHPEEAAVVVSTSWRLSEAEQNTIVGVLGAGSLTSTSVDVYRTYDSKTAEWDLPIDYQAVVAHLITSHDLTDDEREPLAQANTTDQLRKALEAVVDPTDRQRAILDQLNGFHGKNAKGFIQEYLRTCLPTFMYFSHYDRMAGQVRIDDIKNNGSILTKQVQYPAYQHPNGHHVAARSGPEPLTISELVFVDFLEFAGTSIDEIQSSTTYESLNSKCEAASITITDQLREYWTQNPFLEINVVVTKAEADDKPPFNVGVIARARVRNTLHRVSVPFSERSAGFIWFFSFLVKFAQVRKQQGKVILLLDEPGLTLHGKAQADLLRYFNEKITPDHQLIFSTHSPFMMPPEDLTLSRIVEDEVVAGRPGQWTSKGTKVRDNVLATDPDTLFPLQGALGYDVTQSLFIGRHTLLVEGPGDILFLTALSTQLKRRKRTFLDARWTMCPAGGIDKIQSFVSLFAGAKLNVAVMTDFSLSDRKKLDQIKRIAILNEGRIMNFAETLGMLEADVEDIFAPELYLRIVNEAFSLKPAQHITAAKLDSSAPGVTRLVKRVEAAFKLLFPSAPEFDHFTPSEWLLRNSGALDAKDADVEATLDRAELIMMAVNKHLEP